MHDAFRVRGIQCVRNLNAPVEQQADFKRASIETLAERASFK